MDKSEILKALRESVCEFSYTKAGGELRKAVGTLRGDRVPTTHTPKGTGRNINGSVESDLITYYDLDRLNWRSFHPSTLKEFVQTEISAKEVV